MKLSSMLSGTAALLPFALVAQAPGPGDAQRGAQVFNQCKICHSLKAGKNLVDPSLHGVIGRKAGSVPGYAYSPAMKNADVTWNDNTLNKYLTDPKAFIPGTRCRSWASRIQASSGTWLPICIKQPNNATWGTLELDEPEVLRSI